MLVPLGDFSGFVCSSLVNNSSCASVYHQFEKPAWWLLTLVLDYTTGEHCPSLQAPLMTNTKEQKTPMTKTQSLTISWLSQFSRLSAAWHGKLVINRHLVGESCICQLLQIFNHVKPTTSNWQKIHIFGGIKMLFNPSIKITNYIFQYNFFSRYG